MVLCQTVAEKAGFATALAIFSSLLYFIFLRKYEIGYFLFLSVILLAYLVLTAIREVFRK